MHAELLHEDDGLRTFALIFDKGDDPIGLLTDFAAEENLTGSSFTAIGAFRSVTLGYFDPEAMDYRKLPFDEQMEVVSLVGDVALDADGEPSVHAHVVLGRPDGSTRGGHLFEASVWPTLELVLEETPAHLRKRVDDETGLALLNRPDG